MKGEVQEIELIKRAASGDQAAFRTLVETYQSTVRGFSLRLTGFQSERADDLAQEVFILVYRNLSVFRFESKFSTWLYRLTYNVFIDDQRKKTRFPESHEVDQVEGSSYELLQDEKLN